MNHAELKQTFLELKRTSPKWVKIRRVRPEFIGRVIENRTPCGYFLAKEGRKWVAVDNSTFDAWTEEFPRKRQAIRWLRGKFEV